MTLNTPIIRQLIVKDWQLFQKQIAAYVLAGIVALALIGLGKSWSFYLGSLGMIIVLVATACFSISAALVQERKQRTLAFVMSLPVSPLDFTVAKLAANLTTFGVPFALMLAGTVATILFTPLPDGLLILALLVFAYVLFAFCISLAVAMSVESEGWNTFAMIGSMVLINPFLMGLGQLKGLQESFKHDAIVWSTPALAILVPLLVLSVLVLTVTTWQHARKPAFY